MIVVCEFKQSESAPAEKPEIDRFAQPAVTVIGSESAPAETPGI